MPPPILKALLDVLLCYGTIKELKVLAFGVERR